MNELYDLTLSKPLPQIVLRWLLFLTFALHFVFVLLMLGNALLASVSFLRENWRPRGRAEPLQMPFYRHLLHSFIAHKSLAVVLGVGPLLLIQVAHTVGFMTSVSLFAPLWMLIIVFLMAAFFLLEWVAETKAPRRMRVLIAAVVGLGCLLAVPGIFSMLLVTLENPSTWTESFRLGGRLPGRLVGHWALRAAHVLGAALLFGAAYQYVVARDSESRRSELAAWVVGALGLQFVLGVGLFGSLPRPANWLVTSAIALGVLFAGSVLWLMYRARERNQPAASRPLIVLLLLILFPMLVARQFLQDRALIPLSQALDKAAAERSVVQERPPLRGGVALVSTSASTIFYDRSCSFCHGQDGSGNGIENKNLRVPSENLTALRMGDTELRRVLLTGVPGTAMPGFRFYTRDELRVLSVQLRAKGLAQTPELLPKGPGKSVAGQLEQEAGRTYSSVCATCHADDGRGSRFGSTLSPPPPDLRRMTLSPARAYEIISNGYPGTLMPAFSQYAEDLRWALVGRVRALYMRAIPQERENNTERGRTSAAKRTTGVTFGLSTAHYLVRELNLPPSGKKELQIMKKILAIGLGCLLVGLSAPLQAADAPTSGKNDYTKSVDKPYAQVLEAVKEAAKKEGFRVSNVHDIAASLKKDGIQRQPYATVEVCNSRIAAEVLNADPLLGSVMPCRLAVFQKGNGTTVSMLLPSKMMEMFPENEQIKKAAQQVESLMKRIIDEATRS